MKTMAISEFKAHALKVLGRVAESKNPVLITKRGVPLTKVVPFSPEEARAGKLSEALVFEKDIVSPLGEEIWDACR